MTRTASLPLISLLPLLLLLLLLLSAWPAAAQESAAATIKNDDSFLQQGVCGKKCVWNTGYTCNDFSDLPCTLGCSEPWMNGCFCRVDKEAAAASFLTKCISTECKNVGVATDLAQAISVYTQYCNDALPGRATTAVDTGTGSVQTQQPATADSLPTVTVTPIRTIPSASPQETSNAENPSPAASSSAGGLSRSEKIALGCAVGIGIPTILIGLFACLKQYNFREKFRRRGGPQMPARHRYGLPIFRTDKASWENKVDTMDCVRLLASVSFST